MKVTYSVNATRDFGLKKKHADDLDCVVYQPAKDIRQYVSRYILVKRDGKLVFKCKADEQITRLDYDIVCFGVDHKAIHSVNIVDDITEAGYSSEVELPQDTAYVTLLVNSVNGKSLGNKSRLRLSFWNMFFVYDTVGVGYLFRNGRSAHLFRANVCRRVRRKLCHGYKQHHHDGDQCGGAYRGLLVCHRGRIDTQGAQLDA